MQSLRSFRESTFSSTERLEEKHQPKPIFTNSDALKEKVRTTLSNSSTTSIENFYWDTGIWQKIARSQYFEYITLVIIGINAIWIAVELELNPAELLIDADPAYQVVENLFCAYFAFEWLVRFKAFRRKCHAFKDGWFVFDSCLAALMAAETWVMTAVVGVTGYRGGQELGGASVLRVVRLLRLTRMARVARLLRAFPEVLIMVKGIVAAMRSVFITMALLSVIIYMFGIALRQETAGTEAGARHFSTVFQSMYTLLVTATLLDGPGVVLADLGSGNIVGGLLFFAVILISALLLLNLLVGVLVEVVSSVSVAEKEHLVVSFVNEKVRHVLEETGLDQNGDGLISKDELLHILDNSETARHLQDAGVDVVGLVDFADVIFQSDESGREYNKQLGFNEFMKLVLQHRGSNTATVRDIVDLRKFMHTRSTQISNQMARVEDRLKHMTSKQKSASAAVSASWSAGDVRCPPHEPVPLPLEAGREQGAAGGLATKRSAAPQRSELPGAPPQWHEDLDDASPSAMTDYVQTLLPWADDLASGGLPEPGTPASASGSLPRLLSSREGTWEKAPVQSPLQVNSPPVQGDIARPDTPKGCWLPHEPERARGHGTADRRPPSPPRGPAKLAGARGA